MSFYGIPCYPSSRQPMVELGQLYPPLPRYEYVNERGGPVCLGNTPPSGLPTCGGDVQTNCAFRCEQGNGTAYVGGPGLEPRYEYRTTTDMILHDLQFSDERRQPSRYAGPVDGSVGSFDFRDGVRGMTAGALPLTFDQKALGRNEKLMPHQMSGARAPMWTNINTGVGFRFVPSFPSPFNTYSDQVQ